MYLIFDTETTGLPKKDSAPVTELENWPRMVELAWQIHDFNGKQISSKSYIIKPEGYTIPYSAEKIHGISTQKALAEGHELNEVLQIFAEDVADSTIVAGHNVDFDLNIVSAEFIRKGLQCDLLKKSKICTKVESTNFCKIPGRSGNYKWPNLGELYKLLFDTPLTHAHNAAADVNATARCFFELIRLGVLKPEKVGLTNEKYESFVQNNKNQIDFSEIIPESEEEEEIIDIPDEPQQEIPVPEETDSGTNFTHLHVHTQYSILDGAASIPEMIKKAKNDGMTALAITDHGNLFGAKIFHDEAKKQGIKPIIGCEVYVAARSRFKKDDKIDARGDHLIILAKNKTGYYNLVKMVSLGWTEGMYYKPRIDKEILFENHEGLIISTACLGGVIPQTIMNESVEEAEKLIIEYKEVFGDDFYLEVMRHKSDDPLMNEKVYKDQIYINSVLLELGKKLDIKCIATNDVHFINPEDADAHDRLICLNTGKDIDDPTRLKYTRQEWFKTRDEMKEIFSDIPEVIQNTQDVADKIAYYQLKRDPILPVYPMPEGFDDEDSYLRFLCLEGAEKRYKELTDEIKERIDFELDVVKNMGFPGYFLIVQDFINQARKMGVAVGPGRGSAAGSVVAYCTGITNIDPLKYNLLFERFLNPDRVSLPDIDIDFDEDGREDILRWVVDKYGKDKVAHIITFGTMAAKMAIRDVARVQKLPLSEADKLAKFVPERPGVTLKEAFKEIPELRKARDGNNAEIASVLKYAETLEGSVRHTGLHACGIIIGRDSLINHIPVCTSKESDLLVTQFDGHNVEDVGMLKMDFLGLKTLSIIKDTIISIKESRNIDIDIDSIPLDDAKTYELYARGETTGLFQFESVGMKKHLRELKPNRFEDLIAMNALYRPGPMEYIPEFINRKHGREKIKYYVPEMEEFLSDTYGITVYQEQVMQLSQKLAGFTRGEADGLRKAMGKKIKKIMDELKNKFVDGCLKNGYNSEIANKIWLDWEAFAQYAFNKSHSTCYALVSYQTAYLKAHYPAEFMSAVLSRNINDIKKIGFFMDECRRMGISVLGPDVNESNVKFTVNKKGDIRFGLSAIKGAGDAAVTGLIIERKAKGLFRDIYDFVERNDSQVITKKTFEVLAMTGAFDCFSDINRAQYFEPTASDTTFIESLLKYSSRLRLDKNKTQNNLFGIASNDTIIKPIPTPAEDWPLLQKINHEKELIGMYLTAHPLDRFKPEIKSYSNADFFTINSNIQSFKGREICFAGIVKSFKEGITQSNNRPYGIAILEDYTDNYQMRLWGNEFVNFGNYFKPGIALLIKANVEEWTSKKDGRSGIELKVRNIFVLSEVRKEIIRSVTLNIPLEILTETFIEGLKGFIVLPGKGNYAKLLRICIAENSTNVKVDLFSRSQYVDINDKFFEFIEEKPEIEYLLK